MTTMLPPLMLLEEQVQIFDDKQQQEKGYKAIVTINGHTLQIRLDNTIHGHLKGTKPLPNGTKTELTKTRDMTTGRHCYILSFNEPGK